MTDRTPRSDGNAQQHRGGWRKSFFTATQCVEVSFEGDLVRVRDSKYRRDPANDLRREPVITVTVTEWTAFLDALDRTNSPEEQHALHVEQDPDGSTALCIARSHGNPSATVLRYTSGEWESFLAGVRAGELRSPGTGVPVGA